MYYDMADFKKQLELLNPLYWPAWFGLGLLWLIGRLPYRCQLSIGKNIGRAVYFFPSKLKAITDVNIKLCFPQLSLDERNKLAKKNFESLGIGLIEAGMSWWTPASKLQQLFKVNGFEYAEEALAKGKGIILLGPHFTCLEMVGRLLGLKYSFAVMYRPHKKQFVNFIHERFRKKNYLRYIPRHRMRDLIRALNENMAIWYAYDVDGGKKRSVFAPFFGIQTASLTTVSRIAEMSGAAIIPIGFYRHDDEFRYEVNLYPPLENFPSGDLVEDARRLNETLEVAIREKPEQYVWQYKRFKTRPQGEARFY